MKITVTNLGEQNAISTSRDG